MGRRWTLVLALFIAVAAVDAGAQQAQQQMSVVLKQAPVRDRPSFLGKVTATLVYADRVTIEETRGDWFRISMAARKISSGWLHKSALQAKEIALRAGQSNVGSEASSGEVALAGKGFSAEVEAEYRKDHALDYAAVDRMESFALPPERVAAFASDGGLTLEGGTP